MIIRFSYTNTEEWEAGDEEVEGVEVDLTMHPGVPGSPGTAQAVQVFIDTN